jgi:hypothetical protein
MGFKYISITTSDADVRHRLPEFLIDYPYRNPKRLKYPKLCGQLNVPNVALNVARRLAQFFPTFLLD